MANTISPEDIKAGTELFKAVAQAYPMVGTFLAVGTVLLSFIGILRAGITLFNSYLTAKNTEKTKVNTEKTEANTTMLTAHKEEMKKLTTEGIAAVKKTISDFNTVILQAEKELLDAVNDLKIVTVKVNRAADAKLGMIPKVQDMLEKQQVQISAQDKSIATEKQRTDEILKVLTKKERP